MNLGEHFIFHIPGNDEVERMCLDYTGAVGRLETTKCRYPGGNKLWTYDKVSRIKGTKSLNRIVLNGHMLHLPYYIPGNDEIERMYLDYTGAVGRLEITKCRCPGGNKLWTYDKVSRTKRHNESL